MSKQTIVHGFIEVRSNDETVLDMLRGMTGRDEYLDVARILSDPVDGYLTSVISFGQSCRSRTDRWRAWLRTFERVISGLGGISAHVSFDDEDAPGDSFSVAYVASRTDYDAAPEGNRTPQEWKRAQFDQNGKLVAEQEIHL